MRSLELLVSVILFALASLVVVEAIGLGVRWGASGPESGFFPLWLAIVLAVATVVNVVQTLRTSRIKQPFLARSARNGVLKIGLSALGYVLLIEFVGIYVASALFLACFMRWVGGHRWGLCVVVGLGLPTGIFLLFERWFLLPLPKGFLEPFLSF